MSKRAIYYDRCRSLCVEEGYTIPAIARLINKDDPEAPTRRTIQNWADDGNWDAKRKKFVEQTEDLFSITREVAMLAGKKALKNPMSENFNSFARMLAALKYKKTIKDFEDIEEADNGSNENKTEKILELIRKELTG